MSQRRGLHDVRDLSRVAYGFLASKALFGALHLDVFRYLSHGDRSSGELSDELGVPEHRLLTLLSALAGLGLVEGSGGWWRNSPVADRYLVPGRPAAFGDYYRLQIDGQIYPSMQHLMAGLLGNRDELAPGLAASGMADQEEAERFSRAQHAGSLGPALLLNRRVELGSRRHLLDVAGGSGAFAITLCRSHPDLTATIVDFPNVLEVADRYVVEAGLSDRITLLPGDARTIPWPDADVVLMSYLLSAVAGRDIPRLLQRARSALKPGGQLLLHDFVLDDDRLGPDLAALWFLAYLPASPDSASFTGAELQEELQQLGFRDVQVSPLVTDITKLITATSPEPV